MVIVRNEEVRNENIIKNKKKLGKFKWGNTR